MVQSQPGANLGCSYNGSYSCLPSRQRRSNSGTPLHNRITSFWFHTVKSRHTGAANLRPHRVANGSTPRSYPVVSDFFWVLASIQFKQFVELSAAENVLFVFPNELRKSLCPPCYQTQATCRKWRCYNFPVTAYIQVFEFESMYPSPVQIYVPYRGVSSPS